MRAGFFSSSANFVLIKLIRPYLKIERIKLVINGFLMSSFLQIYTTISWSISIRNNNEIEHNNTTVRTKNYN